MLDWLARFVTRRPRWIAVLAGVFVIVAGAIGGSAFDVLQPFGFDDPDSESSVLEARAEEQAGESPNPRVIVLVDPGVPIDSSEGLAAVRDAQEILEADPAIARTGSFVDSGDERFVSTDGTASYLVGFTVRGVENSDEEDALAGRLEEAFGEGSGVTLGGSTFVSSQIGEKVESDLARAELIALPLILLLSFVVFRGVVAALLPPMVGILSILGALLGLRLLAEATDISIFAVNLVIGLGLGLAIDYSLFMVSRYREEMARSGPGLEAMRRTMATAGRTVAYSAVTVAVSLAALMVFPQRFLFSMGLAGAMVALIAAAVSLTVLPAVLVLLVERLNSLAPARLRRAAAAEARGERGGWYRFSRWVMRRPGRIAAATAALLILIGLPFLDARFVFADAKVLPEELSSRQVDQALDERFDARLLTPVRIQFAAPATTETVAELQPFIAQVESIDGIRAVSPPAPAGAELTEVVAVQETEPYTDGAQSTVDEIRALPSDTEFLVGGNTAALIDQKDSLAENLVVALAIIVVATLSILFLMTGSVILPIKALVMNLLTVSAAFGLLVLIFQDGNLEGLLGFTSRGALDSSQPILLFALIFGLSTDYAVFLLTRIKEARDAGAPNTESVAIGLERTGRIITFAAILFSIAIGAFVTSDIVFLKQVGVGTALGVLIDATIVRALLVPSLMRLLGEWNWWAPAPLRRLHARIGVSET